MTQISFHRFQEALARLLALGTSREPQHHVTAAGIGGHGGIRTGQQILNLLRQRRLTNTPEVQLTASEHSLREPCLLQPNSCRGRPHRPHFAGDPWKCEHGETRLRGPDHPWRSTRGIRQHLRTFGKKRLTTRTGRRLTTATTRFGNNVVPDFRTLFKRCTKSSSDGLRCEVIGGGAQATGGDQHTRALGGFMHKVDQAFSVIPEDGLPVMGKP